MLFVFLLVFVHQGGSTVFPLLGPGVPPLHVQPVAGDAVLFSNVLFPSGDTPTPLLYVLTPPPFAGFCGCHPCTP